MSHTARLDRTDRYPRIWVPRVEVLESRDPLVFRTLVAGEFTLRPWSRSRLTDPQRVLRFPNLITNQGLNQMAAGAFVNRCAVGTGTSAPDPSDTGLESQVTSTNLVESETRGNGGTDPNFFGYRQWTFRFSQGAAAGNLAEVAVGPTSPTTVAAFSRARILDSSGNPTTLTVLADEFLDVTYVLRIYAPSVDDEIGELIISGDTYDTVTRPRFVGQSHWRPAAGAPASASTPEAGPGQGGSTGNSAGFETQTLGAITSYPGGELYPATVSRDSYTPGAYYRDGALFWGLAAGNATLGLGSVGVHFGVTTATLGYGGLQASFAPRIPKDDTKVLTINVRHEWARSSI